LDLIKYKSTPLVPVQTISFIFGNLICKQNEEDNFAIKLRICSTLQTSNLIFESFDTIIDYTKSLLRFFQAYTKTDYVLKKIGNYR